MAEHIDLKGQKDCLTDDRRQFINQTGKIACEHMMVGSHSELQSETGYIDARPHIRQIEETSAVSVQCPVCRKRTRLKGAQRLILCRTLTPRQRLCPPLRASAAAGQRRQ